MEGYILGGSNEGDRARLDLGGNTLKTLSSK